MFDIEANVKKLPEVPGVYLHKDSTGKVIYVGKANNLKKRVQSYFSKTAKSRKVAYMVRQITEFEYIVTLRYAGPAFNALLYVTQSFS